MIITALFAVLSVTYAYYGNSLSGMGFYHDEVESIIEDGTYSDLVAFREDTNSRMANWVTSEEDFQLLKERHELMEEIGYTLDRGMGTRGYGRGGCHYLN